MSTKNPTKRSNGGNSDKAGAKQNSVNVTGGSGSEKHESVNTRKDKLYVRRDSTGRFLESANEHMLRAWKSIHKNSTEERKAG